MGLTILYLVVPVFLMLGVIRKYREYSWGRCKSRSSLKGKIFLVTGSNSGVGKETARELVRRNATVVMACRDMNNAELAIKDIRKSILTGELTPMHLDLASFDSIKKFSNEVLEKFPKIHVLVNNAGVYFPMTQTQRTKDGFEMNFGVNHLGHFLLTNLLIERLKDSAPSRIVIVSSTLHEKGEIDLDDLSVEKRKEFNVRFNPGYCASKLANAYHCRELARRLKNTGVDVFAVCPGFTLTRLFRYSTFKWWQYILFSPIAFFYLRTSWQGAQTILYCATEESLKGNSGHFYRDCKVYNSKKKFDSELQRSLWERSEALAHGTGSCLHYMINLLNSYVILQDKIIFINFIFFSSLNQFYDLSHPTYNGPTFYLSILSMVSLITFQQARSKVVASGHFRGTHQKLWVLLNLFGYLDFNMQKNNIIS